MANQTTTTEYGALRLRDLLSQGVGRLTSHGLGGASLDAEVLLSYALGLTREQLIVMADLPLGAEQVRRFESLLGRRIQREPVAYIVGRQEFWSLDFEVTRAVLIPRPETECVIEAALGLAARLSSDKPLRVLDLGTGSGAIAVSLAKELPWASITATDISPAALAIARRNAVLNGVVERISFRCGDWLEALYEQAATFDLIVSNPPYIRRAEIAALEPEVSRWEPRAALDGGVDGLDCYRQIAAQAGRFLAADGALVLEIGAGMGSDVLPILLQAGLCRGVEIVHDYGDRERVAVARAGADRACSS
jgi:release factor glutamine methyltransferase